ncbi:uncharacterized protein LOC115005367 isoform X3 [Cottoperca gobio]|uniref:Uncharacterized protein LOC115005367 isoform X3 n=1 Tax=Cottoperca gobio TaxID=56716 RepID=A0A6J2PAD8_COTGO|nr:uncharacterized protein LOC115005367 isoform X3 [Cottoperca gobio]
MSIIPNLLQYINILNVPFVHKMSVELYGVSGPGGNNASVKGTTVYGTKPLHRFIKGQPKINGIMLLVLGSSFISIFLAIVPEYESITVGIFVLGILFVICGILYILTAHNPTKKTAMGESVEMIFLFHIIMGAIICIIMSTLAVAALRSTNSQASVMMTAMPAETPVE